MKKVIVGIIIAAALIGGGYTVMSMTRLNFLLWIYTAQNAQR